MELLLDASRGGNIDGLYAAIRVDPQILSAIDNVPFVDTPLRIAASGGHTEFAMEIMRLKPSFATKSNLDGSSPIHIAMEKNYTQMVICFVETDPSLVRVKKKEGLTPLHVAVRTGNTDLLQRFLRVCPNSIMDMTVGCQTALRLALDCNNLEAFQLLLDMLQKGTDEETNVLGPEEIIR